MNIPEFKALHRLLESAEKDVFDLGQLGTDLKQYDRFELVAIRKGSNDGVRLVMDRDIADRALVELMLRAKDRRNKAYAAVKGLVGDVRSVPEAGSSGAGKEGKREAGQEEKKK